MKGRWIGIVGVVAVAVGIVAYKQTRAVSEPAPKTAAAPAAATSRARAPAVLLVADPREAKDACGCGQIIRLVRKAGARGVAIREVAPGTASVTRRYHVTVSPTVLFLDPSGKVTRRYQGESKKTVTAVRTALAALTPTGAAR